MPRGNPSGVRSGRINDPGPTNPIIITVKATTYRFSNTGDDAFSVKYTVGMSETKIEVKKLCSIDVKIPAGVSVFVEPSAASPATGVFDLLQTGKPVRGGKFKIPAGGPASDIVLAKRRPGEIYRVFNGSKIAFQTVPAPALAALKNIPPKSSRDVIVPAGGELKIPGAVAKTSGAFDSVDSADIRSGRFVFKSGDGGAGLDYLIVDFSSGTAPTPKQAYRITNTGDESFEVVFRGAAVATLALDQSIDVQFDDVPTDSVLMVRASANNKTLTGIYDSL